jgi:hypothetical protein
LQEAETSYVIRVRNEESVMAKLLTLLIAASVVAAAVAPAVYAFVQLA